MCGIWGIIPGQTTVGLNVRKFIESCAIAGTVRGDHGTGIMMLGKNGVHEIIKGAEDGIDLLTYKQASKAIYEAPSDVWAYVGHNRAATRGPIDDDSAHPFRHGNITLVHNGFISNAEWLPGTVTSKDKNRVDSDLLCQSINDVGYEKAIDRAYGAYALCWHDQRDNALRMLRNSQRPMHMMRLACGGIVFASEGDMLWWVAGRANLGRTEVRELSVDTLLTITSDRKCVGEKIEAKSYYNYNYNYTGPRAAEGAKSTTATTVVPLGKKRGGVLSSLGMNTQSVLEFEIYRIEPHHGHQNKYFGVCMNLDKGASDELHNAIMYSAPHALLEIGSSIYVRPVGITKKSNRGTHTLIVRTRSAPTAEEQGPAEAEDEKYIGPRGVLLAPGDWLREVAIGCTECRGKITIEDAPEVKWIFNETSPICPKCAEGYLNPEVVGAATLQ